jgi:endonuclease/exonuclease/phosphatase family metal-dependent hydrolase
MTWNVGNPDARDPHYAYRLKSQPYEDFVRARILESAPDVVFLQEVLSPTGCASFVERDPTRTCHGAADRDPAVRRLLGPEYSIVCDARRHVECIGVRTSFGAITGVTAGTLVLDGAETPALPLEPCDRLRGECDEAYCDAESTVSAVTVETPRGPLRLVHVHPMAPGKVAARVFWGEPCRRRQLEQVFEGGGGEHALVTSAPTLVAGDFNLDPLRLIGEHESVLWARYVGAGRRFRDLSPRAPNGTQYGTRRGAFGIATDHVLADRMSGVCTVHGRGIGPDPGTQPLDAGFDWSALPGGERDAGRIDHFAITCELEL